MIKSIAQKDIRSLSLEELRLEIQALGEKPFRAKQVYEWLWQRGARSFEEMTNLSKSLRQQLQDQFIINSIEIDVQQKSEDGTIKLRLKCADGRIIEGVLIPSEGRMTACVSSQVGCSLNCKFCATGYLPNMRNLNPGEIFDQVVIINRLAQEHYGQNLSNIVFMGMGEPLLNYKNVSVAIEKITGEDGLNMSPKRITVSTVGIAKMIKKLADDQVKFNLALSLHATTDEQRSEIMAINESNNLSVLADALNYFYDRTKNKITFEYILFDGLNEQIEDARRLVQLCRRVPAKVNVIEYNPIREANFRKSEKIQREIFLNYLENHGVTATLRRSRGKDIDAACGQLGNE